MNNVVYLEWVQIAASKHWNAATQDYFKDKGQYEERVEMHKMAWVVIDHHITYKAAAFENDTLVVTTFVEKFTAVTSERHTTIKRKGENKILVSAITNWCLLKMPEAKPMRVPEGIINLFCE